MPGLDPGIHLSAALDRRVKPGDDVLDDSGTSGTDTAKLAGNEVAHG
jgi:hypothetical protein